MGALKNINKTVQQKAKNDAVMDVCKNNKHIEFTRVSKEERKRLKIDAYGYIL